MHDTLAGRSRVQYEEYAPDEQKELQDKAGRLGFAIFVIFLFLVFLKGGPFFFLDFDVFFVLDFFFFFLPV